MCRAFTEHLLGRETFDEIRRAIEKSGHHLPAGVDGSWPVFGVVRSGVIDYTRHEDVLRTLLAGMEGGGCAGSPIAASVRRRAFHIKPLQVFAHCGRLYDARARAREIASQPYKRRSTTRCWRSIASSRPGSPRRLPSPARPRLRQGDEPRLRRLDAEAVPCARPRSWAAAYAREHWSGPGAGRPEGRRPAPVVLVDQRARGDVAGARPRRLRAVARAGLAGQVQEDWGRWRGGTATARAPGSGGLMAGDIDSTGDDMQAVLRSS
jgi:hypothetical protein